MHKNNIFNAFVQALIRQFCFYMNLNLKYFLSFFSSLTLWVVASASFAQNREDITWHNLFPLDNGVIQGQVRVANEPIGFSRLPASLKPQIRDAVWGLGSNMAGTYIEFTSNAQSLVFKYTVTGFLNMPHMPSTGVSGLDLYVFEKEKSWTWIPGRYNFKDTVSYQYEKLGGDSGKIYRLYLPLYNGIKNMQIGLPLGSSLNFIKGNSATLKSLNPIVVYGTSIAQGGCASRPGLAWPSILGRMVNKEVINLGFSGNGRLEAPIIELMIAQKPSVYILDCLPNMGSEKLFSDTSLVSTIKKAVYQIRKKDIQTPIVLSQHSGGRTLNLLQVDRNLEFNRTSDLLIVAFDQLKREGVKEIHLMTTKAIGLDLESTVDGSHPNDIGMMKHAQAYRKLLKKIRQD
ncbi:MAG: hydrolase [Pedobacter sp.]|nr:MAG: hydrolase [Pedobacter sp.]